MPRFRRSSFVFLLPLVALACEQPTATTPPAAIAPRASHTVAQPHEAEELRLKTTYPGLQTLSEAFPEGSLTIDAQDAATLGVLLLASVDQGHHLERGYDLDRTADGRIVLSFFAAVGTNDEIDVDDRPLYFVQLQCSDEQANALRKRPYPSPLRRVGMFTLKRVIFRLSSASAPADRGFRVLRGTLVAFGPFNALVSIRVTPLGSSSRVTSRLAAILELADYAKT